MSDDFKTILSAFIGPPLAPILLFLKDFLKFELVLDLLDMMVDSFVFIVYSCPSLNEF